jgi:hypothetical protein
LDENQKCSVGTSFWYDYCDKKYGKAVPVYDVKAYGGVRAYLHSFLNLALGRDESSASHPVQYTPGERPPSTHQIKGWTGQKTEKLKDKICPCWELNTTPQNCRLWTGPCYD